METFRLTSSNGVVRTFEGKKFDNEFRVYKVFGDVTKIEDLREAAQELAILTKCEHVLIKV